MRSLLVSLALAFVFPVTVSCSTDSGGERVPAVPGGGKGGNNDPGFVPEPGADPDDIPIEIPGGAVPNPCEREDAPPDCMLIPSGPACGDGTNNQDSEECDDGNSLPGDGCSGVCKVEPYYNCPPEGPCVSTIVCGDGELGGGEACDDGNTVDGDGCAANCRKSEVGYACRTPGQPCVRVYVCGDGRVDPNEACDDKNIQAGDGCSERCRFEPGFTCEGEPSVCKATTCGDGKREGAEGCDDGNTFPFDGCSPTCQLEPQCPKTGACTSGCGDGIVFDEECDDGNNRDGDGCSSDCKKEDGFTCSEEFQCETVNDECVLRVPAIFRDFSDSDPDFGNGEGANECGIPEGNPIVPGIARDELDDDGKPVLGTAPRNACIESAATFARWFRDDNGRVRISGNLVLFDNGAGGYVNRFGENGEKLVTTQAPAAAPGQPGEQQVPNATSRATCEPGCATRVRSGLQCDNVCRPQRDAVGQRERGQALQQARVTRMQLQTQLAALQDDEPLDEDAIAELEEDIAAQDAIIAREEAAIATLRATAEACETDCQTRFDAQVATCVADCKPCSYNAAQFCTGGVIVEYDGTPLFFPVDSVMGPTRDPAFARLPDQYGYNGWPDERTIFPGATAHNFYFTSEVQYWFRYQADTNARLDFTGDDDVWVFVNGRLAVDLGGIHVPMDGSVTINAQSAARFGLTAGNVYKIVVFQAERKVYGSSFKLTLSGFESTPSDCRTNCGDGVVAVGEECDDGPANLGGYNQCSPSCTFGPRCGDGVVQDSDGEACDSGELQNDGSYGGCSPSCQLGPHCGDSIVQTDAGEECDDGVNDGGYGECSAGCVLGPYCGDGKITQPFEECDDGNNKSNDGCSSACKSEIVAF